MDIKGIVVLVTSIVLVFCVVGGVAWVMTSPLEASEAQAKRCNEYVVELDMVKKYNWFWTSYHRRMAFNDCVTKRLGDQKQP